MFADVGLEDLVTLLAHRRLAGDAGDPCRGPVEGGDDAVVVHGEDAIGNIIQDDAAP